MAQQELLVLMNGRRLGTIVQDNNQLTLTYDLAWQAATGAIPLSLSMPLATQVHSDPIVSNFLWGLLPDNEITLSEWGKRHHVSPRNCFALLGAVGEDSPGAVQFVRPDNLEHMQRQTGVRWLEQTEFEDLILGLAANAGAGRRTAAGGQFSLAGAQPKTALARDGARWGIPSGRMPTTHILKPATGEHDGFAENEHFCLKLMGRVELMSAHSEVLRIRDTHTICVERYDRRANADGQTVRLHQEDMCQALGIAPTKKYQNESGPSAGDILAALRRHSTAPDKDRVRFLRALAFNFVIMGTDAHAKNYAVLILHKQIRLTPFYDVGSFLPYAGKERGIKLAMKIGGHYESDRIQPRHWEALCTEAGLPAESGIAHVRDLLARLPGEALGLLHACRADGLNAPVLDKLVDALWVRCRTLAAIYGAETAPATG
jgi:serine/threonine-protein kinase HipA